MAGCNSLWIDTDGLQRAIQNECFIVLNEVADKIIKQFGRAIIEHGAGRTKWRENAAKEFKVLSDKISSDMVEVVVGQRDGIETEAWSSFYAAQIMVALFGNHGPLKTKPGELTFHDHMESIEESHASTVWDLPEKFNWEDPHPENMLNNIFLTTKKLFDDGLRKAIRSIRFSDYLMVSG